MNGEAFLGISTVSLAFCLVCFVATVYLGSDYHEERHHWPIEIGQLAFIHVCKECLDEFASHVLKGEGYNQPSIPQITEKTEKL
jgi:hypothetical protein